jgi:hypothetical protein
MTKNEAIQELEKEFNNCNGKENGKYRQALAMGICSLKDKAFVIGSLSQEQEIEKIAFSLMDKYYVYFVSKQPNKSFDILVKEAFDTILISDVIFVLLKPDGTIGQGVTYEIEFAKRMNKKIEYISSE